MVHPERFERPALRFVVFFFRFAYLHIQPLKPLFWLAFLENLEHTEP